MKTFYAIVLLAFIGLAILGCSESTDQVVAPVEKTSTVSLEKGPVIRSVTGNANYWIEGKMGVLTINAHQYADETVDGVWNLVSTAFNPKDGKMHLEVVALRFYPEFEDGNAVVFWGRGLRPDWAKDYYFASFVVDNGQGSNAPAPDMCGGIVGPYESIDINMTPEEIRDALPTFYVPIDVGNVVIR
jgi:hypothetical protein